MAATATARATALFTIAVVEYDQFVHSFHLLSYRRLSMNLVKKNWRQPTLWGICSPILLVNDVYQLFSRRGFGRKLDHELTAAHDDIFLIQGIEGLLALLADVDQPRVAQDSQVMRDRGLTKLQFARQVADRDPTAAALAHDLLAGLVGYGFGKHDRVNFHRRLSI